jgi:chorismate synthase
VPAAGVVCEAVVALVLADAALESLGGDTVDDFVAAHHRRLERTSGRP